MDEPHRPEPLDKERDEQEKRFHHRVENDDKGDVNKRTYKLGDILDVEEDQEHEFKSLLYTQHPSYFVVSYCSKYINAFLNTNGGTIYFGISDDGIVQGFPLNREGRDDLRLRIDAIVSSLKPQLDPSLYKITCIPVITPDAHEYNDFLFVVEVQIQKGRAPVYRNQRGEAFVRLAGSTYKMTDDLIEERNAKGRPVPPKSKKLEPLNSPTFVGRQQEISQIFKYVTKMQNQNLVIVMLHGSPFVGKSSLAYYLLNEFREYYPGSSFVIDMKGLESKYIPLEEAYKTVIYQEHPAVNLEGQTLNELKAYYESCFGDKRTTLLIENAGPNEDAIAALFPNSARKTLILITSRRDHQLDVQRECLAIRLKAFKLGDAVRLLRKMVPTIEKEDAETLANLLGCMPSPLRVVGSTLRTKKNVTVKSLIKRLSDSEARLALVQPALASWIDLTTQEVQDHLLPLTLFRCEFSGATAADVLAQDFDQTEDQLGLLLQQSMLDFVPTMELYKMESLIQLYAEKAAKQNPQYQTWMTRYVTSFTKAIHERATMEGEPEEDTLALQKANIVACLEYLTQLSNPILTQSFIEAIKLMGKKAEQDQNQGFIMFITTIQKFPLWIKLIESPTSLSTESTK